MTKYDKYVHEFTDDNDQTWFAVGVWVRETGTFIQRMDKTTADRTGCSSYFYRSVHAAGGYPTREQALRRARYLYSEDVKDADLEAEIKEFYNK